MASNMTTVAPQEEPHPYEKTGRDMLIYGLPVLLVVGLIGNTLSFIVMLKQRMRQTAIPVYLAALACADTSVLVLDFINNWPEAAFNVKLIAWSSAGCKVHRLLFNVCYTYAGWLVMTIAIDRFLVLTFPLKAEVYSNRRRATIVVCVLPIVLLVVYLYNLFTWDIVDGHCDALPPHAYFTNNVAPWLTATLYSYIPVVTLFICSIVIIVHLIGGKNKKSKDTRNIIVLVLVVSIMYLILTVPVTVFYLYVFGERMFIDMPPHITLVQSIVILLGLLNHVINFFLYVLTSRLFRADLKSLCGCQGDTNVQKSDVDYGTELTSNIADRAENGRI